MPTFSRKPLIETEFTAPPLLEDDLEGEGLMESSVEDVQRRLAGAEHWDVVECLLWTGLRCHKEMARRLAAWHSALDSEPGTYREAALLRMARRSLQVLQESDSGTHVNSTPEDRLKDSLISGRLSASGRIMGTGERRAIPKEEWSDLSFAAGVGDFGGVVVATTRPGLQGAHFWAHLQIARAKIEALSEEVERACVGGWKTVRLNPMKTWATDKAVEAEAANRREHASEAALCRALLAMRQEMDPGDKTTVASIATTRRTYRSESKAEVI